MRYSVDRPFSGGKRQGRLRFMSSFAGFGLCLVRDRFENARGGLLYEREVGHEEFGISRVQANVVRRRANGGKPKRGANYKRNCLSLSLAQGLGGFLASLRFM
jgi:hypothetical protein